ncbi:MAG: type I-E CRISPR-associated protein Cse1/CasA [Planctomycetes bacterium]|nr:type I-E CRISPR-associated protein Cse1/CasA [Planctomycetota bacterium]
MKAPAEEFHLCSEPWLPCTDRAGNVVHLGLVEALTRAHELKGLSEPSPLVTAALTRFLLAIIHRSIDGPKTMAAWVDLAKQGRFPEAKVRDYLHRVRDRLDLFDPVRPFAQVRGLDVEAADPSTLLTPRSNWGAGTGLFNHRPTGKGAPLEPAVAARWLIARQSFDVGGLVSGRPKSATAGPLTATAVILVRGETLFESLACNLLVYDPSRDVPIPGGREDLPHWEQAPQLADMRCSDEPKRVPLGWLDALTWLSRRIELVVDSGMVVGWKRAAWQGQAAEAARDPMVAWTADPKNGWRAARIDSGRAFWRSSHALFQSVEQGEALHQRPRALAQLASREARAVVPANRRFTITALGIATDKASVELERSDEVHAAASLLGDADAAAEVRRATTTLDSVFRVLRDGLRYFAKLALAPGGRDPDAEDVSRLVTSLGVEPAYWASCEAVFSSFLDRLSAQQAEVAHKELLGAAIEIARAGYSRAIASLGEQARMRRAAAIAAAKFRRQLGAVSSPREVASS